MFHWRHREAGVTPVPKRKAAPKAKATAKSAAAEAAAATAEAAAAGAASAAAVEARLKAVSADDSNKVSYLNCHTISLELDLNFNLRE